MLVYGPLGCCKEVPRWPRVKGFTPWSRTCEVAFRLFVPHLEAFTGCMQSVPGMCATVCGGITFAPVEPVCRPAPHAASISLPGALRLVPMPYQTGNSQMLTSLAHWLKPSSAWPKWRMTCKWQRRAYSSFISWTVFRTRLIYDVISDPITDIFFPELHHTSHYRFVNKSLDFIENCENGGKFKNAQFPLVYIILDLTVDTPITNCTKGIKHIELGCAQRLCRSWTKQ